MRMHVAATCHTIGVAGASYERELYSRGIVKVALTCTYMYAVGLLQQSTLKSTVEAL
jgi:hypothetical protein